ncbi:hypothetical protein INR49_022399 [Caranx melampygus]|nr:hypothetical protein INR49_022399 [Caranx melampygus]
MKPQVRMRMPSHCPMGRLGLTNCVTVFGASERPWIKTHAFALRGQTVAAPIAKRHSKHATPKQERQRRSGGVLLGTLFPHIRSRPNFGTNSAKPGVCPRRRWGSGLCAEFCSNDSDCPGNEKCCHNGCGHECIAPYTVKPGRCALPQGTPMCAEYCYHDGQCPGEQKCCRTTCGHACKPVGTDVQPQSGGTPLILRMMLAIRLASPGLGSSIWKLRRISRLRERTVPKGAELEAGVNISGVQRSDDQLLLEIVSRPWH